MPNLPKEIPFLCRSPIKVSISIKTNVFEAPATKNVKVAKTTLFTIFTDFYDA